MAYVTLARKYRPQTFDDLIGQPHVTATLMRALDAKRIAQAYLFAGLRGVGKTSAARILAKCLNCAKGPAAVPCNTCSSCTQITQGSSLDVIEIDGASNRGIDEIRSLRESVPFAPTTGQFRVYIIDEVHMLTTEAFNALLKTLEEPPAHVKFIFATTAASKVPATILSRCQRFDFRRIEPATVVEVLQRLAKAEKIRIDEAALYAIARASDGSLRDAEVTLEQVMSFVEGPITERHVTELLGSIESDAMTRLTDALLDRQAAPALAIVVGQVEQGRDSSQILAGLVRHLRNLLIVRSLRDGAAQAEALTRLVDEPSDRLSRLQQQAGRSSPQELLVFLQMAAAAYDTARRSPFAQTLLEMVVVKIATREQWQSLDGLTQRLEQLGRATGQPAPAASAGPSAGAAPGVVPATPPASSQAPEDLLAIWPAFLERLGAQKMSLAAYMMHAQPLQRDGSMVTVGLAAFALHQEVLSLPDNRRLIDQLLSEACGERVVVQYSTLPEPRETATADQAPAAPFAGPPMVQDIVNLFNATIMNPPKPS